MISASVVWFGRINQLVRTYAPLIERELEPKIWFDVCDVFIALPYSNKLYELLNKDYQLICRNRFGKSVLLINCGFIACRLPKLILRLL